MRLRGTRLDRAVGRLSARERVSLIVRSIVEQTPEDETWRTSMPPEQYREYDRLLHRVSKFNQTLGLRLRIMSCRLDEVGILMQWLQSLKPKDPSSAKTRRELAERISSQLILYFFELQAGDWAIDTVAGECLGQYPCFPASQVIWEAAWQRFLEVKSGVETELGPIAFEEGAADIYRVFWRNLLPVEAQLSGPPKKTLFEELLEAALTFDKGPTPGNDGDRLVFHGGHRLSPAVPAKSCAVGLKRTWLAVACSES